MSVEETLLNVLEMLQETTSRLVLLSKRIDELIEDRDVWREECLRTKAIILAATHIPGGPQ